MLEKLKNRFNKVAPEDDAHHVSEDGGNDSGNASSDVFNGYVLLRWGVKVSQFGASDPQIPRGALCACRGLFLISFDRDCILTLQKTRKNSLFSRCSRVTVAHDNMHPALLFSFDVAKRDPFDVEELWTVEDVKKLVLESWTRGRRYQERAYASGDIPGAFQPFALAKLRCVPVLLPYRSSKN